MLSLVGLILTFGGVPGQPFIGGKYWSNPGPLNNGFLGFSSVLIFSAFSLSGLEIVGLAASEMINYAGEFPSSVRRAFWLLIPLSIVTTTVIGFLVPYTDIRLLGSGSSFGVEGSPFIIAITDAALPSLRNLFNATIVIATLSTAMSSMYITSRITVGLARQHQAPLIFAYIDRKGRPIVALLCSFGIGLFALLGSANQLEIVLAGVISFSGMSSIFVWASICLAHIRFRRGWSKQGHSSTELVFRSPLSTLGSWYGFCFAVAVLVSQLWTCIGPNAYIDSAAVELIGSFAMAYVYGLLLFILYAGYKLWYRTSLVRSNAMVFYSADGTSLDGRMGTEMNRLPDQHDQVNPIDRFSERE